MRPFSLAAPALVAMLVAAPVAGQTARALGTVRDTGGRPLKGATIRAVNPDAYPPEITSTSDDKGRWAMIGLRTGTWSFLVEAPGFDPVRVEAPVRVGNSPPMAFTLARDLGPLPGALDRNVQQLLAAANALRDQGQYDQAIAAYQEILAKNPKFTAVNLVVADVYRKKAAREPDPVARRALLERAIESYGEILKNDAENERAKTGLESARAEAAAVSSR